MEFISKERDSEIETEDSVDVSIEVASNDNLEGELEDNNAHKDSQEVGLQALVLFP